jgi:Type II CAAX prenyl endopeptidase Rce1-like
VFLYACVDRGRLFTYFGWTKPRRALSWLYALPSGVLAAIVVLSVVRIAHMSLNAASPETLLYGVTLGPILEELLFRGAAFSVIYVTASSVKSLARLRITLAIIGSSLLFALAHEHSWNPIVLVLWDRNSLRASALAIQFNRHRSSHARYIQRSDCHRNAASLTRSTLACRPLMCSISPGNSSFDAISSCGYTQQGSYRYASGDHNDSEYTSEALHSECAAMDVNRSAQSK